MKFFIDSANIGEIKQALAWGILDGVTTNPSLVAREKKPFLDVVTEICRTVSGPVSLEVVTMTTQEMVRDGRKLAEISKNVIVKLPMTMEALAATQELGKDGIKVNMTLCFSALQALLAAKAGAAYISPFVGRLDDVSQPGMELISQIVQIYDNYDFDTEVLVASIRNPVHVLEAALIGADVSTIPFSVMQQFSKHPLTDSGIQKFLDDWKKVPGV